jgi:16S rRNA (guanine966-N2)-methyltransferase
MQQSRSKTKLAKTQKNSQVRVIAGSLRGRKITFSSSEGLRPTLDRVRETLFNWLASDIHQAHCLDLFAGSGALGIEAISRGAASVTLVDANRTVAQNLCQNLAALTIKNATVIQQPAESFLQGNQQKFDLVFLDPPFEQGMLKPILGQLSTHLSENALIYVEQENSTERLSFDSNWEVLKSKKTGRFYYELIRPYKD